MKYTALVGKIGALSKKFLTREDFAQIVSKGNVNEIASFLREKEAYSSFIPKSDDVHRRELEASLYRRFFSEIEDLKKFLTYPEKKVAEHILLRCEIETLKKILRLLHVGESAEERFFPCGDPFKDIKASSVEEFVSALKGREYYNHLSSALFHYKETGYLNQMENALDFWYFKKLHKLLRRVGSEAVLLFLKKQIDLMNALWIFRSRILFKLSPETSLNMIIPLGLHLRRDVLSKLSEANSQEEFLNLMDRTPYRGVFATAREGRSEYLLERAMEKYLYRQAKKLLRSSGDGFAMLAGYIHVLEYEIKDLITAIETVRYKLGVEEAERYFIRGGINA